MLNERTRQYLQDNREHHLHKLFELIRIPSVSKWEDEGCQWAAGWLAWYLKELGMDVEVVGGHRRPNVIASMHVRDDIPTVLFYGHYDVQPVDPWDQWQSPPFDPQVRDGWIYARGADDDKGQLFTHLMAIDAHMKTDGLPVNVKLLLEGEEELGSPCLERFLQDHKDRLACDVAVVSDSSFFAADVPSITYGFRGLICLELTLTGANRDLHSGHYGGAVANPADVMARLIGEMHDERGQVTLDGFYKDVFDATEQEIHAWAKLGFDEAAYAADLGVEALGGGEHGRWVLERIWGRPTIDCNGMSSGVTGHNSKTIIPASAEAEVSIRLVPDQDTDKIEQTFRRFVEARVPPGIKVDIRTIAKARPLRLNWGSPAMRTAAMAYEDAFGKEPVFIRSGCSVPVTELIDRILEADQALMSFGLPEDRLHSPNERFPLKQLYRGAVAVASFMQNYPGMKMAYDR
jgi:acetylornithine deacetylase/succinyl-diaminopimelate desuccinylase-like protein